MFKAMESHAELIADVRSAFLPVDRPALEAMVRGLRGYGLLAGGRGQAPADVDAFVDLLATLCQLVGTGDLALDDLELNPVLVHQTGVTIVDAVLKEAKA